MLNEYKKRLDALISLHNTDIELNHKIGKDPDCAYCDEYKVLSKKYLDISKKTYKQSEISDKQLYFVTLSDESEYLVYVNSEAKINKFFKSTKLVVDKINMIPYKYWQSYYIENESGSLSKLSDVMEDKKMRVVAKKETSNHKRLKVFVTSVEPFSYIIHRKQTVEKTESFVTPCTVLPTKKFNTTGKIAINTNKGNSVVKDGQVILKLPKDNYVVYDEDDFNSYFFSEDSMVWKIK